MGQPRTKLHELLQAITDHVYFQPPETVKLEYPCIIYKRDDMDAKHANNVPYDLTTRYEIMVIARDPETGIPEEVAKLPMCSFNRFFTADGLNHDVYQLFF